MNAPADVLCADPRLARIVDFFERLAPPDLQQLPAIYTPDAAFKDPFNEVRGADDIRRVFEHMFATLDAPRFVVHDVVVNDDVAFLSWDFVFGRDGVGRGVMTIRGASKLRLAADGRIADHRDYWDAAEELYEKLPGVGALMRWLKRRLSAGLR